MYSQVPWSHFQKQVGGMTVHCSSFKSNSFCKSGWNLCQTQKCATTCCFVPFPKNWSSSEVKNGAPKFFFIALGISREVAQPPPCFKIFFLQLIIWGQSILSENVSFQSNIYWPKSSPCNSSISPNNHWHQRKHVGKLTTGKWRQVHKFVRNLVQTGLTNS